MMMARSILHAEDDENDAFLFRRALFKAGVANPLTWVPNGEVAVEYLTGAGSWSDRGMHPFPSLLITDLKMPALSGFDLLGRLKDLPGCAQLRVVVLSASVVESDKERCRRLGAHAYFVKPSDFADLIALAGELKRSWIPSVMEPA
jgi:CheY-like chemotaxis protein